MHHKRKNTKNQRSGCLMCKPHKMNRFPRKERMKHSDAKRMMVDGRVRFR